LSIFVTLLIFLRITTKIQIMEKQEKGVENIMKIQKVTGFYIKLPGDMSVGIQDSIWQLDGDFYFDNVDELEEFRALMKLTFESYCGDECRVETFEEQQLEIDEELEQI
jgi:hypothetical protein